MALSITCSSTFTFPCPFTFRSTFKGTFLLCTVTYVNVYSSILCSYNVSYHRCRALWWFFSGPSVTWGWRSAAVGLIGCKRLWTESLQQNHTTSDQTLIVKVKITPTERDRKIDGQEETDRGGDTERRKQRETKKTERQGHTHTLTESESYRLNWGRNHRVSTFHVRMRRIQCHRRRSPADFEPTTDCCMYVDPNVCFCI